MKKWTDVEISNIGMMPIQGVLVERLLQQFMKNQNEIIDWIEAHDKKPKPFSNTERFGGSER